MKRSFSIAAAACVVGLLVVVAPALSVSRYHAEAVDFSMAPPPSAVVGKASARGAGVVSRPLRTTKRFNLVGLTWRKGGAHEPRIAIRTRRQDGKWTRWSSVATQAEDGPDPHSGEPATHGTSNPDWVGEADWVQYRSSQSLRGLRLQFMNVRGTATRADRARSAVRRVANTGVVSVAGLVGTGIAKAGGPQPAIVKRAAWGASQCTPRSGPAYGEVKTAFVHHTVNANDYTRDEAPDVVLAICRYHRNSNGWNDIGYNFLVDRFGTIYEGRAGGIERPVIGAHAQGYNAQSTGIANIGTFSSVQQTPEALSAMARLIRWKLPLHGAPTAGTTTLVSAGGSENRYPAGRRLALRRVIGHRDTGATSCPGEALYAQLPRLRSMVGDAQPGGLTTRVTARVRARRSTVSYGATTPVTGSVTAGGASPNASLPVQIQAFVGTRWKTVTTTTTNSAGAFASTVKPLRTRNLRARFPGQSSLRAATSKVVPVGVRPIVSVTRPPKRTRSGVRTWVRGKVRPRRGY
ncbi:MAG: peptidoglycan recognition protein family protein, partial [Thermoleophilaceae bacterium]